MPRLPTMFFMYVSVCSSSLELGYYEFASHKRTYGESESITQSSLPEVFGGVSKEEVEIYINVQESCWLKRKSWRIQSSCRTAQRNYYRSVIELLMVFFFRVFGWVEIDEEDIYTQIVYIDYGMKVYLCSILSIQ